MAIPRKALLALRLLDLFEREPVMQAAPDRVRVLSERRRRSTRLPGAWLFVGRAHPGVRVRDLDIGLAGRTIGGRLYTPDAVGSNPPLILNFHGGGFASGDPRQSEWWCTTIAAGTGAVVLSVDYRKAPEFPYPSAPEDCYDATVWAVEHAHEIGADPNRLAVMGDSAGGNLAAVVTLMARDRSGPAIAHQVLVYPAVEFAREFPSERENRGAPVLTKADMDGSTALYFHGLDPARQTEPYASPLRADLHGLPPALIQTAQADPLRDQGRAYADKLRAAGVPVRLTNYVDAPHGYISLAGLFPAARQAAGEAVAELRAALVAEAITTPDLGE